MTTTTHAPLTATTALALAKIIGWARDTAKIAWVTDDNRTIFGHARYLTYDSNAQDVRDAQLRITTRSGMELFVPVAQLLHDYFAGSFVQYDWDGASS